MATGRAKGAVYFSCDECPETYEPEPENELDHALAWQEAKTAGWVCAEVENEWLHFCGACARAQGLD
jgi:hypothetical protein